MALVRAHSFLKCYQRRVTHPVIHEPDLSVTLWHDSQDFTYQGTVDNFETEYYSGVAHNYTLDCSGTAGCGPGGFYIWYMVDENYRPLEQGEGCQVMPRTSSCASGGSYLYHNYGA